MPHSMRPRAGATCLFLAPLLLASWFLAACSSPHGGVVRDGAAGATGKQDGATGGQTHDPADSGAGGSGGATEGQDAALDVPSTSDAALDLANDGTATTPQGCLDGATRLCKDDPDLAALGNCGGGVEMCTAGHWGACSVVAAAKDSCALMGDDATCNGKPNEGCPCVDGSTQPCGPAADVGICKRGTQTCAGSTWGACTGAVFAAARDCTSAADNNCDGLPDNTADAVCVCAATTTRPCDEHAGKDGKGRCKAGTQTCVVATDRKTSAWGTCTGSVGPAAADACSTGNDDNCNGMANEGCTCVEGSKQPCGPAAEVGICKKGSQTCTGGAWGTCVGAVFAAARDCTSMLDNDCSGMPDNTIDAVCACASGGTQACGQHAGQDGKGPCKAGSQTCVVAADKKSSAWGTCTGAVGPAPADGCDTTNDDNCNGIPHEGCSCVNGTPRACGPAAIGICKPGTQTCTNASWPTACPGAVTAKARDCTSTLDNDCSGLPDNQDPTCVCPAGTTGPCPGNNNPPCKSGTRTCMLSADKTSTSWSTTCSGQVLPAAADTCVADNDANCNLMKNEGCECIIGSPPKTCPCGTKTCDNTGKLGACVTTCSATQTCNTSTGQCGCAAGLTSCNGACVNLQTDAAHCGDCGTSCATNGMACTAGQCTCTASTPNGKLCRRPGDERGVCWGGSCVLNGHASGCSAAADCVPGGCSGGYCLGGTGLSGQVSCSANNGAYVVCSISAQSGCTSGSNSQVFCGDGAGGTGAVTCDGPSDCPGSSDCCGSPGGGSSCAARTTGGGGIGSGCPSVGLGSQTPVLCDPTNPVCPAGKACGFSGGSFLCL